MNSIKFFMKHKCKNRYLFTYMCSIHDNYHIHKSQMSWTHLLMSFPTLLKSDMPSV